MQIRKNRITEAPQTKPAPIIRVLYPEHGTGRSAKLTTCRHCGGKPLIVRRCGNRRICAVCSHCGYHHRVPKLR
jgi:hypothetical protein